MTSLDDWYCLPELTGQLIRLRPLAVEDTPAYLEAAAAGGGANEVFQWLSVGVPGDLGQARVQVASALAARARGERFAYAQLDASSGRFLGTTSYYELDPLRRALAIGHTWLSRPAWRSGRNTESKLLLLAYAFDELMAARVTFHTDIRNTRSQAAIERLGARKEGVLRKHRIRADGSWRDTVQYAITDDDWPNVRHHLAESLAAHPG